LLELPGGPSPLRLAWSHFGSLREASEMALRGLNSEHGRLVRGALDFVGFERAGRIHRGGQLEREGQISVGRGTDELESFPSDPWALRRPRMTTVDFGPLLALG
jgi:hypothetical protein